MFVTHFCYPSTKFHSTKKKFYDFLDRFSSATLVRCFYTNYYCHRHKQLYSPGSDTVCAYTRYNFYYLCRIIHKNILKHTTPSVGNVPSIIHKLCDVVNLTRSDDTLSSSDVETHLGHRVSRVFKTWWIFMFGNGMVDENRSGKS